MAVSNKGGDLSTLGNKSRCKLANSGQAYLLWYAKTIKLLSRNYLLEHTTYLPIRLKTGICCIDHVPGFSLK